MARTRVRRRRLALVAAVCVATVGGARAVTASPSRPEPARTHVVRPGETLWAIATRLEPSQDPRIVAAAIADANDVEPGSLAPGQELLVPAIG